MRTNLLCVPGIVVLAHAAAAQLPQPEGFSTQNIISQAADFAQSVVAADLDGDGDVDTLSASQADGKIAWYENLGGGAFGPQRLISQLSTNPQQVLADDLDGDGDLDVLWTGVQSDQIVWHPNLGGGSFGPGQALSLATGTPWSITTSDLDGDGDRDIVAAFLIQNGRVAFFQNLGGGVFGPQQSLPNAIGVYRYVRAADLNGDGRPDLLVSRQQSSQFQIIPNFGNLTFGAPFPVPAPAGFQVTRSIEAADLDGDGNLDLLTTLNTPNGTYWHRNLGGGIFGPRTTISNQVAVASDALAADFDQDGDLDVVASGAGDFDSIGWFENLGVGSFSSYKGIVPENNQEVASVSSIFVADVDGDTDLDVLSSSVFDDKIAWYSNLVGISRTTVYCTSGTTTSGCNALINANINPNVANNAGVTITVANVEGQKQGIYFYGVNNTGFTPSPWSSSSTSFLCVKGPTQRAGSLFSGGTNNVCNGGYSLNWDAFVAANPTAIGVPFAAGDKVFVQAWFRDPPAPKTTNLSNAVELTVQP
jgi:hypothetical protein